MQPEPGTTTDLLGNAVNGLVQGTVGAAIGVVGTLLVLRFQREVRRVEYTKSVISLVGLNPQTPKSLQVIADKSLLTGDPADANEGVIIQQAFAIEVVLENTGNRRVDDLAVDVSLDETVQLASFATKPEDRPDYAVTRQRDTADPNSLYFSFPYLNPGSKVSITLIAVREPGIAANNEPRIAIDGRGRDVRFAKKRERRGSSVEMVLLVTTASIIALLIIFVFAPPPNGSLRLPASPETILIFVSLGVSAAIALGVVEGAVRPLLRGETDE